LGNVGLLTYVRLTAPQAKFLEFIAARSGKIPWDWGKCREDVAAMVGELVSKSLLSDLRAEGSIRLTDQGRSAVSQIEDATRRVPRIVST
jgi:hypothetical protein